MDINKIVAVYVKMRDEKARIKKEAVTRCDEIQKQMDRLNGEILRHLQEHNMNSARTDAGTVYKKEDIKPSVKDWVAFDDWLAAQGVPPSDAYEKRVSRKFVTDYMKQNAGTMPVGVSVHREYVANVKRNPHGA